jgi:hypothetical protein
MNEYLSLFKALPVEHRTKSFSTDYISHGVLVENSVVDKYGKGEVTQLIKQLVPSDSQLNKTFHKSWKKVRDASIEQLVVEQLIHYFTTYGLEALGFYNEDTVYLPNEELELEGKGGITFYILRGITPDEISKSVQRIISSGIALSDSDLSSLITVIVDQKLPVDPSTSSNREMAVRLYELLGIIPEDPVEYLRLQIYLATSSTLLIKNKETIEAISSTVKRNVFQTYEKSYGLTGLASIFYRFKPLFLAFKNKNSASTVNQIRKLAVKHHRPMPEDYLASVTKHLRNDTLETQRLWKSLGKANIFRKIKLVQALRFYNDKSASGIVYSIRNGKSFTSTINSLNADANEALSIVMTSLSKDLGHLHDKKVYMDTGLVAPTSGKMFYGDIPFGSYFSAKDSLVLGVSWKNTGGYRIDLDLSIVSISGKIGWDAYYRNEDFLFSGDITDAPRGATEAHLIRKNAKDGIYLLNLNYYNGYEPGPEVPFTLFVTAESEFKRMKKRAMMSQDNMLFWADSTIDAKRKQKSIGVLKIRDGIKTFHVFESKMSNNISARRNDKSMNMISYYDKYLDSLLDLRELLEWSGAKFVDNPSEADIDLSMSSLTKDTLIKLLTDGEK